MDFFAAQDRARGRTRLLVLYFVLGVAGLIVALYAVVMVGFGFVGARAHARTPYSDSRYGGVESPVPTELWWRPGVFSLVSLATLAVVGGACAVKVAQLHGGGGAVADSLGAVPVARETKDLGERRLLNIIEEMALAAGVPVPAVYIIEEDAINACAAGFRPENAAVIVTRGSLKYLTRDELQGVIGHEFSHILNGDMRLNLQLIGAVFGLMVLTIIGRELLYATSGPGNFRSRSSNDKGDGRGALLALGLALLVLGWLGVLFGRLIQAAVSRQRECLADASAVQFTRNPDGLAGALKKIGGLEAGSQIHHAHVEETAHLFFAPALNSIFATHPPLPERILALEPGWDGKFIEPKDESDALAAGAVGSRAGVLPKGGPPPLPSVVRLASVMASAAQVGADSLANVRAWRNQLPTPVVEALQAPRGCRAVALALALDEDPAKAEAQLEHLRGASEPAVDLTAQLAAPVRAVPRGRRLLLLELALAGLAQISPPERASLRQRLQELVDFDHEETLYEFALLRVAECRLDPKPPRLGPPDAENYAPAIATLLSEFAHLGAKDAEAATAAFKLGLSALPSLGGQLTLAPATDGALDRVAAACTALEPAPFWLKKQVLMAAANVAQHDNVVEPEEAELLRALGASLGCPLPVA